MTESLDQQLTKLVEAGWHVIESDFDAAAFRTWRAAAVKCLSELIGPEFESSRYFGECSSEAASPPGAETGQTGPRESLPLTQHKRVPDA
jgi:hypothetical protein